MLSRAKDLKLSLPVEDNLGGEEAQDIFKDLAKTLVSAKPFEVLEIYCR